MSHIADISVAFNDLDALGKAFAKVGATLHLNRPTYRWVGRWYDDSPVPKSLFADEAEHRRVVQMNKADRTRYMENLLGKCKHCISFPGVNYDVGVVEVNGDLRLVWDWATPLRSRMGSMDGWGRDSLSPLTPILHDYVTLATGNLFDQVNYTLDVNKTTADGVLHLEYVSND